MNRIGFLSALVVALLALPASSQAKDEKRSPQVELVRRLYKDFAWEAVLYADVGESLAEQPKGVLKDYFEGSLAELMRSDAECALKRDFCRLDVDPLFGTRAPCVHNLEVLPTDSANRVLVRFSQIDGGAETRTEIVVQLAGSGRSCRISDMLYRNGPSLKMRLMSPMEE